MTDFEKDVHVCCSWNTIAENAKLFTFLEKRFAVFTFKNEIPFCNPYELVLGKLCSIGNLCTDTYSLYLPSDFRVAYAAI